MLPPTVTIIQSIFYRFLIWTTKENVILIERWASDYATPTINFLSNNLYNITFVHIFIGHNFLISNIKPIANIYNFFIKITDILSDFDKPNK